ncbi:phosphoglycerate kinase, partial [Campylobacter jejuni]
MSGRGFNGPQDEVLKIPDDRLRRSAIPRLRYCFECGSSLIITSHLARPKEVCWASSMETVARRLGRFVDKDNSRATDVMGEEE